MNSIRKNEAPPEATEWGWKYHHLGIPVKNPIKGGAYLEKFKLRVSGFETSPFGIEWMYYEEGSPINELVRTIPHIAFQVDDLDKELARGGFHIITAPNSPGEGIRVAMIEHDGAPIELIEFRTS